MLFYNIVSSLFLIYSDTTDNTTLLPIPSFHIVYILIKKYNNTFTSFFYTNNTKNIKCDA